MNNLPDLPHDINSPEPYLPGIHVPWWLWTLAALACLSLLVLLISHATRKRPAAPPAQPSLFGTYRRQLEALAGDLEGKSLAEIATAASLILRGFLAQALAEPSLYETHEQTLARDNALQALPEGARQRLVPLLNRLAEYKYGPSRTDPSLASGLVDDCLEVLSGLSSTRPRSIT